MIQGSGDDNNDDDHDDVEPPIKMKAHEGWPDSEESAEGSANGSEENDQNGENFELPEVGN